MNELRWVRLADSDWVNVVNAPSVLDPMKDKEEAVREAVKLTEARLKELNTAAPSMNDQQDKTREADAIAAIRHTLMTGLSHNPAIAALNEIAAATSAQEARIARLREALELTTYCLRWHHERNGRDSHADHNALEAARAALKETQPGEQG